MVARRHYHTCQPPPLVTTWQQQPSHHSPLICICFILLLSLVKEKETKPKPTRRSKKKKEPQIKLAKDMVCKQEGNMANLRATFVFLLNKYLLWKTGSNIPKVRFRLYSKLSTRVFQLIIFPPDPSTLLTAPHQKINIQPPYIS